jgi:hypothetical protein
MLLRLFVFDMVYVHHSTTHYQHPTPVPKMMSSRDRIMVKEPPWFNPGYPDLWFSLEPHE